jgi:CRISPR-associated protein Cas1
VDLTTHPSEHGPPPAVDAVTRDVPELTRDTDQVPEDPHVDDAVTSDVPELVPARMVNEFSYCQRLFFLEWVHAQFADNIDTVEGRWHHRAVDEQAGAVPLPDEGQVRIARSVMLSSTELGLVAKIDLLEGAPDGTVIPVDTKRGAPPDRPEQAWEPERVQVCVQALLLREHGYRCERGMLWFAGTRQRVVVELDDALVERTMELLADLRRVASSSEPPPPLLDSPKCPRCSLVGICLPDEVNTLAERSVAPPRQLVPRGDAPKPLYVTEQGAVISKDKGRLQVTKQGERLASVRVIDVSHVCIYGNVQLSSQVLRELFARDIAVCWFTYGGWFSGLAEGLPGRNVELRRRQTIVGAQGGLEIARRVVNGKILNSRTLLRRNSRERSDVVLSQLKRLADQTLDAASIGSLLGLEGAAARIYFSAFPTMLRADKRLPGSPFSFEGRNRRPPTDPVNCLLGYLYGLLTKELTATAFAIGFDPYQGFYHRPRFGRPALALDLAEEFRPLVAESVVVNLVNNGEVTVSDFLVRAGGVTLTQSGRKVVLAAYERRMATELRHPLFGYRASYRRILEVQCRLLAAHLLGEVPAYVPVTTR